MGRLRWFVLAGVHVCFLYSAVKGATPSVARCPRYVEEGDTLTCTCTPGDCTNSQVTVTWLNQSPASDTLEQTNVRREDNGTQFTCQMVCGGETSTVTYVLQVGYGPSENNVFIVGNSTLITDGSRLLNLTCVAREVNPVPVYSWLDPVCQANSQGGTCSFTPQIPWDDRQTVRCRVADDFRVTPQVVVKELTVDLKYPPFDAPVISGYTPGQMLKTGDILTCTVTGGKPLVESVDLSCDDPAHQDKQDTLQRSSVSSSLTIDLTNVMKDPENISCHCSGYWAAEDDLYALHTNATFYTEYPPHIVDFTLDGSSDGTLSVNESNHVTVTLRCSAYGRPAPLVYLMKNGTEEIVSNDVPDKFEFRQVLTYRLSLAECEQTGTYTCFVNNGLKTTEERAILLSVNCAPRLPKQVLSDIDRCPRSITDQGFDLLIVARPRPEPSGVKVTYLGDGEGRDVSVLFVVNQSLVSLFETKLQIREAEFTNLPDGNYSMEVTNALGSLECLFQRRKVTAAVLKTESESVGVIVGGSLGGISVLALLIVIAVVVWKKRYQRYERPQPKREDETSSYTDLQSAPFSNSEQELTPNYDNLKPRPDLTQSGDPDSYVNVEPFHNTYEQLEPKEESESSVYTTLQV